MFKPAFFSRCIALIVLLQISNLSYGLEFVVEQPNDLGELSQQSTDDLCTVAQTTQTYIAENSDDSYAVHAGKKIDDTLTLARINKTLAFICEVNAEDKKLNQKSRLTQVDFLKQHFEFIRWMPDKAKATAVAAKSTNKVKSRLLNDIPADEIFLTKYYTKLLDGSEIQTSQYSQALYAIPFDETHLTLEQAQLQKNSLVRYRYTRQEVIAGALQKNNLAKPLIWLTEEALHDVLLQGTGVLNVNGQIRYFNVHRNNGIAYDYHIGKSEQARYWYFIETPEIMGYGQTQASKIAIKPQVTFAGNVAELGLGKLIMVSYEVKTPSITGNSVKQQYKRVSRMGILADQGGAFDDNLFQLDLLVDSYRGWSDYHQANKQLPDYAQAWVLLLKE